MDLVPSSTKGPREMHVSFDWEHSPGTMILGPIEYKVCLENKVDVLRNEYYIELKGNIKGQQ